MWTHRHAQRIAYRRQAEIEQTALYRARHAPHHALDTRQGKARQQKSNRDGDRYKIGLCPVAVSYVHGVDVVDATISFRATFKVSSR